MPLREVQDFLARYVRDQELREGYRNGRASEIERSLGMSEQDIELVRQINFDELSHMAEDVVSQRMGRTNGVFGMFLEHLSRYVDVNAAYREFDRQWPMGWWPRRAEIRRFEAYALDLIVRERLPEYLVDVCRFCSHVTIVAETPKVPGGGHADLASLRKVLGNMTVALRKPLDVVRFRHDPIRMLDDPEHYGASPTPRVTDVLIQRDWRQHKRSRVFRLGDHPVLEALCDSPRTVFELGAALPEFPHATLLELVAELYVEQVVHLYSPPELVGDLASARPYPTSNREEGRDDPL